MKIFFVFRPGFEGAVCPLGLVQAATAEEAVAKAKLAAHASFKEERLEAVEVSWIKED